MAFPGASPSRRSRITFGARKNDMSDQRKATMAKRQREMDQKDRVKERESRRNERRLRIQARASLGRSGPEIEPPVAPPANPVFDEDGPRSVAELRAARLAEEVDSDNPSAERRFGSISEAVDAD
jgi:hypothetical protein